MRASAAYKEKTSVRNWQRASFRRALRGWIFASPLLIYLAIFVFLPIFASLAMVFYRWNGFGPLSEATFIGLGNVIELLNDARYIGAFRNTFLYAIIVVSSGSILGLVLALVMDSITLSIGGIRALYYLPVMLPITAMSLLWGLIYQPRYGVLNQLLQTVGIEPVSWLLDPETALPAIAFMVVWKNLGWYMIIFLAGLNSIPEQFYEAARIDGANGWQQFWRITIPLLKPTILFVLVISIIGSLQVFSPVYIMTQGGPANATNVVVYSVYTTAFEFLRFGYATTQAAFLFVVILGITIIQLRIFRQGGMTSYM